MKFAPIVLFVYSRPKHTQAVLCSLSKCKYAKDTCLYIFSDAAKKPAAEKAVEQVREIINDPKWSTLFRQVTVTMADENKGLAKSVISGVTQVINEHGSVIVVEDDNRLAEDFIDYMCRGLEFYENNSKIGFVGAYTMPIAIPEDYKHDVFIMGRGSSYSWATWKDRWDLVDWEMRDYSAFRKDHKARARFNEYGDDRSALLDSQMFGRVDSWAIRFSYAMFKHNYFAVLPVKTRVENIGFDGTGVHNTAGETRFLVKIEDNTPSVKFEDVEIDPRIKKEFTKMFKASVRVKLRRMLRYLQDSMRR